MNPRYKGVVVILDGIGDLACEVLGGATPLAGLVGQGDHRDRRADQRVHDDGERHEERHRGAVREQPSA